MTVNEGPPNEVNGPDIKPLNEQTRHGFENSYVNYQEHLRHFYLYYYGKKFKDNFTPISEAEKKLKGRYFDFSSDWKNSRNKVVTTYGGIFICLNTTVDPPDSKKGKPCSVSEGWINPYDIPDHIKAAHAVTENVVKQYRAIAMKASFKGFPDAVVDDMKKALITWRRSNKENNTASRFLFHYNGHGVPNPTTSGEFWVFNRQYSQYIPVPISELQQWIGAPCVLIYDCNKAGNLVNSFKHCTQMKIDHYIEIQEKLKQQAAEEARNGYGYQNQPRPADTFKANAAFNPTQFLECYQFAACSSDELLPSQPDLPADLFTCCMTTPIEISVKFFLLRNPLTRKYYEKLFEKDLFTVPPGADYKLRDHKLPDFDVSYFKKSHGEKKDQMADLSYIYTSVTDTIAYTSVPRNLFRRCFRQDVTCLSLFRNFLLAQRIMRYYNCNPISDPVLPDCHNHELWDHWDLAIEHFLTSLMQLKNLDPHNSLSHALQESPRYIFSNFFDTSLDHLKNWIQYGHFTMVPPPQLTMILQLLLTPKYRARALKMLAFFVDLGPWAVSLALNAGVFPYVVKLLQSPVIQLKPMLTFVWAKLLACDYKNMQYDLCASSGGCYRYFYYMILPEKEVLSQTQERHKNAYFESIDKQAKEQKKLEGKIGRPALSIFNSGVKDEDEDEGSDSDIEPEYKGEDEDFEAKPHKMIDFDNKLGLTYSHLTVSLVVLTLFVNDCPSAREKLLDLDLYTRVIGLIERSKNTHPNLQLWGALFLAQAWCNYSQAKYLVFKGELLPRLIKVFQDSDSIADLRAAIVYSFTTFLTIPNNSPNSKITEELENLEITLAEVLMENVYDASPAVRKEMVIFLSTFIYKFLLFFQLAAFSSIQEEIVTIEANEDLLEFRRTNPIYGTVYSCCWRALLIFSTDPHDEVQLLAEEVIVYVISSLTDHPDLKEPFDYCYKYLVKKIIDVKNKPADLKVNKFPGPRRAVSAYNPNSLGRLNSTGQDSALITSAKSFSRVDGLSNGTKSFLNFIKTAAGYPEVIEENDVKSVKRHSSFSGNANFKSAAQFGMLHSESFGSLPHPLPSRFTPVDLNSVKSSIPLKSHLLEFVTEYYQYPLLSSWPENDPLIDEYDFKFGRWRKSRNDAIISSSQADKELSLEGDWSIPLNAVNVGTPTKTFEFTQFDPFLVTTDNKDVVKVYDYEKNVCLSQFSNNNPAGSKISQLQFMNEDDRPILLVGCNDGSVRLYRDFHDLSRCRLVTSWQTLNNVIGIKDGANFTFEWQQARGDLLATGNTKTIDIWNAYKERCYQSIAKRNPHAIISLTCDQLDGNIFAAGFSNGDIRVYDKRCKPKEEMIQEWRGTNKLNPKDRTSINNLHMQRGGFRELVSSSNNGLVQLWDIRSSSPVDSFDTGGILKCMRVHEHAPVFATGSNTVKVWSTSGYVVSDFYNDSRSFASRQPGYFSRGYLNGTAHTLSNVVSLALHPHKMVLAATSAGDSFINIYRAG